MKSSKQFYHHLIIYSLLFFLGLISVSSRDISSTKRGFSLGLIDPLSPLSPFYNPNLTKTELFNKIFESDRRRLRYFMSLHSTGSTNFTTPTEIRPPLLSDGVFYMVDVGIGTGNAFQHYYLHVDTGSSLTWIQCEPCHNCFHQQPRLFDPKNSPSYAYVRSTDDVCDHPPYHPGADGHCEYHIEYADDSFCDGVLSVETFTLATSDGGNLQIPIVGFGCTHETDTNYPLGGPVGIFGMNLDPESFMSQGATSPATGNRFSYCLVEPGSTHPMTLRFGDDITFPPVAKIQETPILRYDDGFGFYYVNLTGMSIDGTDIYFAPGTFDRDHNGHGGFLIDSGARYSYLPRVAYQVVRNEMVEHFEGRKILPVPGTGNPVRFDLCFNLPANTDPKDLLPSMTLHFEGADLPLYYEQVFYVDSHAGQFCLAIFPVETDFEPGVLGAFQQANTQFEFDMSQGFVLRFATVDCTHGV